MVATMLDARVAVLKVVVTAKVRIEPAPRRGPGPEPATVSFEVPVASARAKSAGGAGLQQVGAVERGVGDGLGDLVAQGHEVVVQSGAAVGVQRAVRGGQRLGLHLAQQVGDGFAGRDGDVDGRLSALDGVLDRRPGPRRPNAEFWAMAQMAPLSLAEPTFRPVLMRLNCSQLAIRN